MIKEICTYVATNTSFTIGTDLFALGTDPDEVDECIIVSESAPGLANALLTDLRFIPLIVYSRAATRFTARDNAYTVFNLLHGTQQVSLAAIGSGPVYVCNFSCRTAYYMGLDETGRRHTFALAVDVNVTNML